MSKDTKVIPAPSVCIDTFFLDLFNDRITAYAIINDQEQHTVFSINQGDFEKFCDDNELRDYERNIPGNEGVPERDVMCQHSWPDIYDGYELMEQFLKAYIEFLYEPEECSECEGTGETFYSCCGDDLKGTDFEDIAMCPTCHEHLGGPEACDSCGGTGTVIAEPKQITSLQTASI